MPHPKKPANATWHAKHRINPRDAEYPLPDDRMHEFGKVEVAWYGTHRAKFTIPSAGPCVITQAFVSGEGRDVIIEVQRIHPDELTDDLQA